MSTTAYQTYFKEIKQQDEGTEHSFRTYFQNLLNDIKPDKKIKITHEPKKEEGISGKPDFKIEKNGLIIGYIETKKLGANLDNIINGNAGRDSIQLEKYLKVIPNLILTNYNEFILFKNQIPVYRNVLFYPSTDRRLNISNVPKLNRLFTSFFTFSHKPIVSPKKLSSLLAERTKLFRDFLKDLLKIEEENEFKDRLLGLKKVIEDTLIEDFSLNDFIDAYAQTITYGLFLAEINSKENISEDNAHKYIPKSMGILRDLFKTIDIEDIPDSIDWILEEIIDILNRIDRNNLQNNFSFSKIYDYEDPYVYFYENFLGDYDKDKRKSKGVYYTPIPVVNFILKSIDHLLKENFNPEGLIGEDIKVLDFATGTGTFLLEAFKIALENIDEGMKENLIHERLLKNYHGFEYLIAPYTIAHLKLSQYLKEIGYPLKDDERFKIYLTDTLDRSEHKGLDYFTKLTKEGLDANRIKITKNILVLMGNPPYSSESKNNKEWILDLTELYKKEVRKEETNIKPLNDDYIKFIRYAQWKIENNHKGIIGIISNNSYLDGLVHRGMRKELYKTFDKIYILNLHGNSIKGEQDENVFDIRPGVSIALFLKLPEKLDKKEVYYYSTLENRITDREIKYAFLLGNDVDSIKWDKISLKSPNYWLIKKDLDLEEEYKNGWSVLNIFEKGESGFTTHRDQVAIQYNIDKLKTVIEDLISMEIEEFRDKYNLPKDSRDWTVEGSKISTIKDIKNILDEDHLILKELDWDKLEENRIKEVNYRPFDYRFTYYNTKSKGFVAYPRWNIMKNFIEQNLGLVLTRQLATNEWKHVFITDKIGETCLLSTKTKERAYIYPLYSSNQPNFTKDFIKFISKRYSKIPKPEEILGYIYAVLYSNTYREKYNEFLKTDFPKVPFTKNFKRFRLLSKLGSELIDTHLLIRNYYDSVLAIYPINGDNIVDKINFDEKNSRLFINKEQYFDNVPKKVWNMEIGGYKVLDKWLKYRKKDKVKLSFGDIAHLQKIIRALDESLSITDEIDQVYQKIG